MENSHNSKNERFLKAILAIADHLEEGGRIGNELKRLVGDLTGVSELPDIDLHTLEHDENWRSWKKDERGACSFPAEEGHSGWVRISKAGNAVLTLFKSMKQRGLEKVSLGLFEYRISGDDFLQRRPLKEPAQDPHERMERNIGNTKLRGAHL